MEEFKQLEASISPAQLNEEKTLAMAKLFFVQIELMVRSKESDNVFKSHVLYRLKEAELITIEYLKSEPKS